MSEREEFVSVKIKYVLKIKASRTSIRSNCIMMDDIQLKPGSDIHKYDFKNILSVLIT